MNKVINALILSVLLGISGLYPGMDSLKAIIGGEIFHRILCRRNRFGKESHRNFYWRVDLRFRSQRDGRTHCLPLGIPGVVGTFLRIFWS